MALVGLAPWIITILTALMAAAAMFYARRSSAIPPKPVATEAETLRQVDLTARQFATAAQRDWLGILDAACEAADKGHHTHANVSAAQVADIADAPDRTMHRAAMQVLHRLRLDLLISNSSGQPAVAALLPLEAAATPAETRDRNLLRDILARADIPFLEIMFDDQDTEIAEEIYAILLADTQAGDAALTATAPL
ncbi:MAG: DUF2726 domain-containing protein [Pseudomonadota bacterium]